MKLAIVGLGYVGLPLAHAFAAKGHDVLGYDISSRRVAELKEGKDSTRELTEKELKDVKIEFSDDPNILKAAEVIILAIPTPVDDLNNPDLTLVESASKTVGEHMGKGVIVVYESTVYPGVTEEICGPILEKASGLICGKDFTLGYSPERINPGDKEHTVARIMKIVAGQDEATLQKLTALYGSIVKAGIHQAPNIKVAEMAKAIENAQRDLNIAFVNEIALLCHKIGIETKDVLTAAGTKWNFLKFNPGLVGGHCIGVDPYYLVEKAKQLGMQTNVIAAGRAINDSMAKIVAEETAAALSVPVQGAKVLVLGLTFKENIPDLRNSKSQDVIERLIELGCAVSAHDPFVSSEHIKKMNLAAGDLNAGPYDAVVLLVPHKEYIEAGVGSLMKALKPHSVLYDLKSLFRKEEVEKSGRRYLAL